MNRTLRVNYGVKPALRPHTEGWTLYGPNQEISYHSYGNFKGTVEIDLDQVELIHVHKEGESSISMPEYRQRLIEAKEVMLGGRFLDVLMEEHNQPLIPESWKQNTIYFFETEFKYLAYGNVNSCIRTLKWDKDHWEVSSVCSDDCMGLACGALTAVLRAKTTTAS